MKFTFYYFEKKRKKSKFIFCCNSRERWEIFKNWHKLKNVSPYEPIHLAEVFADKPVEKQADSSDSEQTAVDDDGFRIESVDEEQVMTSSPDKSSEAAVKSDATQVQKESMQEEKESKPVEKSVKRPSSRGKADEHMLVPTGNVVDHKVEQRSGGAIFVLHLQLIFDFSIFFLFRF